MFKKLTALLAACALVASLAACSSPAPSTSKPAGSTPATSTPAGSASVEGLKEAFAEQPILLTSGGQSADFQMIGTVMGKLGLDYTSNNLATSADLGSAKTLVVVVGGSSKGLGAAGIDADGELARLAELIKGAKDAGMSVIAMHTGGSARRGDLSDKFIAPVFNEADYAIVVSAGDSDGLMAGLCGTAGIPMDSIESISDVTTVLPAAFK